MTAAVQGEAKRRPADVRRWESNALSLVSSAIATLISWAIANAILLWRSQAFLEGRQPRTEFAFSPIAWHSHNVIACFALGAIAFQTKRWPVPLLFGLLFMLLSHVFAWSGPGWLLEFITPLLNFRFALAAFIYVSTFALLFCWSWMRARMGRPAEVD